MGNIFERGTGEIDPFNPRFRCALEWVLRNCVDLTFSGRQLSLDSGFMAGLDLPTC